MKDAEYLLSTVKVIIDKYEFVSKSKGEDFNIFSILNMERNEVETHSMFIYELLNPEGCHGQKDLFLKLFLCEITKNPKFNEPDSDVSVEREYLIESSNRRIDFIIKTQEEVFGIEMKIDAEDQKNQLSDYKKELEKMREKNYLFYLTLTGTDADEHSCCELKSLSNFEEGKYDDCYFKISFREHILNWLNKCISSVALVPTLREAIYQYKILIEKIINKRGKSIMEIADILEKNENLKTAIQISEALTEVKINIQTNFWEKLKDELDKEKIEYKFDFFYLDNGEIKIIQNNIREKVENYYKKGKDRFGLICRIKDDYDNKDISLTFCVMVEYGVYFALGFVDKNKLDKDILEKSKIPNEFHNWKDDDDYFTYYKNAKTSSGKRIRFKGGKSEENSTILCFNKQLDKEIKYIVNEIKCILNGFSDVNDNSNEDKEENDIQK